LALDVVSPIVHTRLGLPHSLALGLSNCICGQPLDPMGIHLFCCTHGKERTTSHVGCLCIHHERCWLTCCVWADPYSSTSYPLVLIPINRHCVFSWWHLHIDWCCHCWHHSNGFDFVCCIVSRMVTTIGAQAKKKILSKSIPYKLVYPSHYWGLWVFTSIS
jgi:hypothetical protein